MSHTLMAVLGTVVMDNELRRSFVKTSGADRIAALKGRGFFLSHGELEIVDRMMYSLGSAELDEACERIARSCPNWPCSYFDIA